MIELKFNPFRRTKYEVIPCYLHGIYNSTIQEWYHYRATAEQTHRFHQCFLFTPTCDTSGRVHRRCKGLPEAIPIRYVLIEYMQTQHELSLNEIQTLNDLQELSIRDLPTFKFTLNLELMQQFLTNPETVS